MASSAGFADDGEEGVASAEVPQPASAAAVRVRTAAVVERTARSTTEPFRESWL
jgi:hypothetical protein